LDGKAGWAEEGDGQEKGLDWKSALDEGQACRASHNSSVTQAPHPSDQKRSAALRGAEQAPMRALGVTLSAQVATTASLSAPAVLAPIAAPSLGQSAADIGWFTSLAYCVAMFAGLFASHQVSRRGAVRLTQFAMLASALGLMLLALRSLWTILPAALAIGLAYGCTNPAAADILSRHTPAHRRGLFFSLKQTGVPLGVAAAGLAVSVLVPLFSWAQTVLFLVVPCLAVALLSEPMRQGLDGVPANQDSAGVRVASSTAGMLARRILALIREPLALVISDRRLRILGLSSFAFASTQVAFLTFLVTYLHLEIQLPLALAALLLAVSQGIATLARVFWGYLSDRWIRPSVLLGLLGLGMALGMLALAILPPGVSRALAGAVAAVCAATAVAWNGVFFAEISSRAPPGRIAQVNGGTQFLTFFGAMLGPVLFGLGLAASGNYRVAIAGCGLLPLAAAAGLWRTEGADRRR